MRAGVAGRSAAVLIVLALASISVHGRSDAGSPADPGRPHALSAPSAYALRQDAALQTALARYRLLAVDPSFSVVPPFVATLRPGAQSDAIVALRRELMALNDLPPQPSVALASTLYDDALADAVKRFQRRHGLEADGAVGRSTVAALRVPLAHRVRQIERALERLSSLPRLDGGDALLLNIPMFRLSAFDAASDGVPVFEMNAIVGRAGQTPTPALDAGMTEVVFRPSWNVPDSILRAELLPKIVRNAQYLQQEELEIVGVRDDVVSRTEATPEAISMLRRGTLRLRQRPGPKNALGLVKFVFPNEHDVYMHGTPAPSLFARARRDFSHGCMRVADPIALAEWVLRYHAGWTRDRIVEATRGSETVRVPVARPVRVVVFYMTADVAPDGAIRFAEDIYGADARFDAASGRRTP